MWQWLIWQWQRTCRSRKHFSRFSEFTAAQGEEHTRVVIRWKSGHRKANNKWLKVNNVISLLLWSFNKPALKQKLSLHYGLDSNVEIPPFLTTSQYLVFRPTFMKVRKQAFQMYFPCTRRIYVNPSTWWLTYFLSFHSIGFRVHFS